jgi:hypothetical protein
MAKHRSAKNLKQFERVFAGGRTDEPDGKTIDRMVARQKAHRKAQRCPDSK